MKKDNELSWLRQAAYFGGSEGANELRSPFSIQLDGRNWTACTDGQRILAIKGGRGFTELSKERQDVVLKGLGVLPENAPTTSFANLLEFVMNRANGPTSDRLSRCRIGGFPIDAMKLVGPLCRIQPPADGLVRIRAELTNPPSPLLIDGGEWKIALMGLNPEWVPANVPKYELLSEAA